MKPLVQTVSAILPCLIAAICFASNSHGQTEKPITVLSSLDPELIDFIADQVNDSFPKIDFVHLPDDAAIPQCVRSPGPGDPRPDLLYGVSTIVLSSLADQDLLAPYTPDWKQSLPVGLSDRDQRWHGLFGEPITIVFNRIYFEEDIPLSHLPEGWEDLGHARFRGSILMENPTPYNMTGYLFACIIDRAEKTYGDQNEGFELITRWDRNLLRTYDARETLLSTLALFSGGDGSISVAGARDIQRCSNRNLPIDLVLPAEGLFLYPRGVALVKGARTEAGPAYRALTNETLLQRVAAEFACYPLIAGNQFSISLWPGERITLEFVSTDHDSVRRNIDGWISRWQNLIQGQGKKREQVLDDALNTAMTFLIPLIILIVIFTSRKPRN